MTTDKLGIEVLAECCRRVGMRYVIVCPGSRNAPLIIAFSNQEGIECLMIPDERVAGYFALGIAQHLREPVGVICTSGTAVLNLMPAVCEAFYLKLPLLIMTADRPSQMHFKGENQTIEQAGIFGRYTKDSNRFYYHEQHGGKPESFATTYLSELQKLLERVPLPMHFNIELNEPLYNTIPEKTVIPEVTPHYYYDQKTISRYKFDEYSSKWRHAKRKMIIVGQGAPNEERDKFLREFARKPDVVVIGESLSNLNVRSKISNLDQLITLFGEDKTPYIPEIVITIGGKLLSKEIRKLFADAPHISNWHFHTEKGYETMFPHQEYKLLIQEHELWGSLMSRDSADRTDYAALWQDKKKEFLEKHQRFLSSKEVNRNTDLFIINKILETAPGTANIHFGNSTPVRYGEMLITEHKQRIHANRGTSGIDGCVSTAAGAAYVSPKLTIGIFGDMSFFYDSNSLWHTNLSQHLRIIIINNGGGNIFRLINDPTSIPQFEKYFETKHDLTAKHLADMYNIPYFLSDEYDELEDFLPTFYRSQKNRPAILEIKTNGAQSEQVYKRYFEFLRTDTAI